MRDTRVFFVCGFLESGKTSMIRSWLETLEQDRDRNLILCFEEGEVEYDSEFLKQSNAEILNISDDTEINRAYFEKLDEQYRPDNVFIEWNGMRSPADFFDTNPPDTWFLVACVAVADASTYAVYSSNMRSLFADYFRHAYTVIFNRCSDEMDLLKLRAGVKAVNPSADIIFTDPEGYAMDLNRMPFDMDADPIVISDDDFGLWFTDAVESIEKYTGKRISVSGRTAPIPRSHGRGFYIQRPAMTCCAEDMSNISIVCMYKVGRDFTYDRWVTVTGTVQYALSGPQNDPSAVPYIQVEFVKRTQAPESELVNFS